MQDGAGDTGFQRRYGCGVEWGPRRVHARPSRKAPAAISWRAVLPLRRVRGGLHPGRGRVHRLGGRLRCPAAGRVTESDDKDT